MYACLRRLSKVADSRGRRDFVHVRPFGVWGRVEVSQEELYSTTSFSFSLAKPPMYPYSTRQEVSSFDYICGKRSIIEGSICRLSVSASNYLNPCDGVLNLLPIKPLIMVS